jgi:hypothetical protein
MFRKLALSSPSRRDSSRSSPFPPRRRWTLAHSRRRPRSRKARPSKMPSSSGAVATTAGTLRGGAAQGGTGAALRGIAASAGAARPDGTAGTIGTSRSIATSMSIATSTFTARLLTAPATVAATDPATAAAIEAAVIGAGVIAGAGAAATIAAERLPGNPGAARDVPDRCAPCARPISTVAFYRAQQPAPTAAA